MNWLRMTILIVLLTTVSLEAQIPRISGLVKTTDSTSIAYVHLILNKKPLGIYSDKFGRYSLEIHDKNLTDTIQFSAIGYQNFLCTIKDLQNDPLVFLQKEIYHISPITVYPKNREQVKLAEYQHYHLDSIFEFTPNTNIPYNVTFLKYFPNEKNQDGILKEVAFYFGKKGKPKSPFGIRILSVDSTTQLPKVHVLNSKTTYKGKKDQWVKFDLSNHNIVFPKEGLFIGMEWIYPDKRKYRYKTKKKFHVINHGIKSKRKRKIKLYGQTLKASRNYKSYFLSWVDFYPTKQWYKNKGSDLFIQPTVTF